jgi:Holliday junction resolvase-like predicted endonuclease
MSKDTAKLGRATEIRAHLWLLQQGYEVFNNIFPTGPVDAIAMDRKTGNIIKIEIRTASERKDGTWYCGDLTQEQVTLRVQLLVYLPSTQQFILYPIGIMKAGKFADSTPSERAKVGNAKRRITMLAETENALRQLKKESES